jgi:hypothetical protein
MQTMGKNIKKQTSKRLKRLTLYSLDIEEVLKDILAVEKPKTRYLAKEKTRKK